MNTLRIDDSDREIIKLLREDGRLSFVDLARGVGMSPDAVKARMTRLADEGAVRVLAMIDPALLGYHVMGTLALDYRGDVSSLVARLRQDSAVTYLATTLGEFNVICEVVAADDAGLGSRVQQIVSAEPGIARAEVLRNVEVYKWEGSGTRPKLVSSSAISADDLDDLDLLLLRALVDDPRISYRELADRVGRPYSLVRRRALRLFDVGAIESSAVVEHAADEVTLGVVCLHLHGDGADATLKAIAEHPEVKVLARTLGRFDAIAEVAVRTPLEMVRLGDRLRSEAGVQHLSNLLVTQRPILPAQWRVGSVVLGER